MKNHSLFNATLFLIREDLPKAKRNIQHPSISPTERKILNGFILLRESKFDSIIKDVPQNPIPEKFIEAQRNLLLGCTFNNSGQSLTALPFFEVAIEYLTELGERDHLFYALYNEFYAHHNLMNIDGQKKIYEKIKDYSYEPGTHFWFRLNRIRFIYLTNVGQFDDAKKIAVKMNSFKSKMGSQRLPWMIDLFNFAVQTQNFDDAYLILEEMKQYRTQYLSADYVYMKLLLNFIVKDQPLYVYEQDLSYVPQLFHQAKVLACLDELNLAEAYKHWHILEKTQPYAFGKEFHWNGGRSLFSLAYGKILNKQRMAEVSSEVVLVGSKEDMLFELLKNSPDGVSKEQAFKLIWKKPTYQKDDIYKLSKVIQRVKEKYGVSVKSKKGLYYLEQASIVA